jgi:hypothetical protein
MPIRTIKFVCTDKKLKQGQLRNKPGICFKTGLKAGFAAGISKEKKKQEKKKKAVEATAQAIVMSKFKTIPVATATNDLRKTYLKELKVPNYRALSAEQTIEMLRARGYNKLIVPRVK